MKLLPFIIFFIVNISLANEQETTIILENKYKPLRLSNLSFNVDNSNLGRAWITIDITYNDFDDYLIQTVRTKLPGLYHDTESGEIILDNTLCATTKKVMRRRFLRKPVEETVIENTDLCKFKTSVSRELVTIDDGYDVKKEKRFVIRLKTSTH